MTSLTTLLFAALLAGDALPDGVRSHPPLRPLPTASERPLPDGPLRFVDDARGDDAAVGSREAPWRTLARGVEALRPGETLVLRGGVYHESVTVRSKGTAAEPITIRAFPRELVTLDGGHAEFLESPATAWEPVEGGAPDEYRSTAAYEVGGGFGRFAGSMIPFQRYRTFADLRSANELWHAALGDRSDDPIGIYAGPGARRDAETGRIHVRLSHTRLAGLGRNHYRGETDPRRIPLIVSRYDYTVELIGAEHVRLQNLVLRGSARAALKIENGGAIELNGLTLYGSSMALRTQNVDGLRMTGCDLRGHSAPWHSRGHHKDRAGSGYLVLADGDRFEFAGCEFTDHHDGIQMAGVENFDFHHNLVENFNDDGLEPGKKRTSGRILIHENRIARCLLAFSLHGGPAPVEAETGSGVYIYRNVVDQRGGVYKVPPTDPDPAGEYLRHAGQVTGDHGSPIWPVFRVYHNTFALPDDSWRNYYGFGWGNHTRDTTRRVYNNIFLQVDGLPGLVVRSPGDDFEAGGNLFWGVNEGPAFSGDFFGRLRRDAGLKFGPGRGDRFGNPKLASAPASADEPLDVRLTEGSAAIDAGVPIPPDWPDPLRETDAGRPDVGAAPFDARARRR